MQTQNKLQNKLNWTRQAPSFFALSLFPFVLRSTFVPLMHCFLSIPKQPLEKNGFKKRIVLSRGARLQFSQYQT